MKNWRKIVLLTCVLLPLLGNMASAAKLTVVVVGTGHGDVMGRDIICPNECIKVYSEKTIVHLTASPYTGSQFIGWMVNGAPHEGVITIDQDDIIVAARFESDEPPNDMVYRWYNGSYKMEILLTLDEIGIFLEPGYFSHDVNIQEEIAKLYHPQAEITKIDDDDEIYLKRPDSLPKEELPQLLAALKEHSYIKQVSPVFYRVFDLERDIPLQGRCLVSGEIGVKYPRTYTEKQIHEIELEYGLGAKDDFLSSPRRNRFTYHIDNVLESFDIANRLFESGKVLSSSPSVLLPTKKLGHVISDSLASHQWNLEEINLIQRAEGEMPIWCPWCDNSDDLVTGQDVVIGIIDDGLEHHHEDLTGKVLMEFSRNYREGGNDPSPPENSRESHGTACAGIIGATGFNDKGMIGVAPQAMLAGYRVKKTKEKQIADAFDRYRDDIHIYNYALGKSDIDVLPVALHEDIEEVWEMGVGVEEYAGQGGREGKGNIYVVAVQDEGQCDTNTNSDGLTNSPYTITVAASRPDGTHADYSNTGATILVNAPSSNTIHDPCWANKASDAPPVMKGYHNNSHDRDEWRQF